MVGSMVLRGVAEALGKPKSARPQNRSNPSRSTRRFSRFPDLLLCPRDGSLRRVNEDAVALKELSAVQQSPTVHGCHTSHEGRVSVKSSVERMNSVRVWFRRYKGDKCMFSHRLRSHGEVGMWRHERTNAMSTSPIKVGGGWLRITNTLLLFVFYVGICFFREPLTVDL